MGKIRYQNPQHRPKSLAEDKWELMAVWQAWLWGQHWASCPSRAETKEVQALRFVSPTISEVSAAETLTTGLGDALWRGASPQVLQCMMGTPASGGSWAGLWRRRESRKTWKLSHTAVLQSVFEAMTLWVGYLLCGPHLTLRSGELGVEALPSHTEAVPPWYIL